jgi:hypothetical protein
MIVSAIIMDWMRGEGHVTIPVMIAMVTTFIGITRMISDRKLVEMGSDATSSSPSRVSLLDDQGIVNGTGSLPMTISSASSQGKTKIIRSELRAVLRHINSDSTSRRIAIFLTINLSFMVRTCALVYFINQLINLVWNGCMGLYSLLSWHMDGGRIHWECYPMQVTCYLTVPH